MMWLKVWEEIKLDITIASAILGSFAGLILTIISLTEIKDWFCGTFQPAKYGWGYIPLWLAWPIAVVGLYLATRWIKHIK